MGFQIQQPSKLTRKTCCFVPEENYKRGSFSNKNITANEKSMKITKNNRFIMTTMKKTDIENQQNTGSDNQMEHFSNEERRKSKIKEQLFQEQQKWFSSKNQQTTYQEKSVVYSEDKRFYSKNQE